jgi:hypothetical protein
MDAVRDGQPVTATTIAVIKDDPKAWDGKWVRLEGRIDKKPSWLHDANGEVMFLEPAKRLPSDGSDPGDAVKRAAVSGRVDLTCWKLWDELYRTILYDDEGNRQLVSFQFNEEVAYCHKAQGPNLVDVLVATLSESAQ